MATRKQRKSRKCGNLLPAAAIQQATTLTEYRKLRGLPDHVPITYFPEIYTHEQRFGAEKRAVEALQGHLEGLQAAETAAQPANAEWTIEAAVCFERYPRITPDRTEEEQAWDVFDEAMHIEKSALMQVEQDWTNAEREKAARLERGESDFGEEETKFVPAPRETAADASNDTKSLNRKLAEKLFLVTNDGSDSEFRMPQVPLGDGETLRQAAERGLREVIPESTDVYFLGNAPSYCETKGKSKIFYFRALLVDLDTDVQMQGKYKDFKWLSIPEIQDESPQFAAASDFLY